MTQDTHLGQLQMNMQNINTTVIVLDPGQIRRTQTGTVLTMKVADHTGSINATVMNPDFIELWKCGDILKIKGAYTNVYQGGLTLNMSRNSECKKSGEFTMHFSDIPDISTMPLPAGVQNERRPHGGQDSSQMNRNPQQQQLQGGPLPFQGGQRGRPSH